MRFGHSQAFLRFELLALLVRLLSCAPCLIVCSNSCRAEDLAVEIVQLPPLLIYGQPARAHTQGLEITDGSYYVTARRDDVLPKRALLLRTDMAGANWSVWDITPLEGVNGTTTLDHAGGMQSDGKRLWVPIAESKQKGRSIIRVFPLAGMVNGSPLESEFEFSVNDHIGAVAVSRANELVFGANWDTETVYVWDFDGRLKQTLTGLALRMRTLGRGTRGNEEGGVAVQDWKFIGDRLFASGLFRSPINSPASPRSRFMAFESFLKPAFQHKVVTLPLLDRVELGREAMAISDGVVHFIPEDLGATNRLFKTSLASLLKRGDWR